MSLAGGPTEPTGATDRLAWMRDARLGLFIHWGLYALPARHEWVKQYEQLTDEHYQRYFDHFDPDLFDPEGWAAAARRAGMRYMTITTKHHDGFCLWDSALTDYKATNTPAGRDLLRPLLDAFRAEGLRVGLYHSLLDWHHPEFAMDGLHPQREDKDFIEAAKGRDMEKYVTYLHGQVEDLLTGYGKIDYLFFDFSYPTRTWGGKGKDEWHSAELIDLVKRLQPEIVINDRLDLGGDVVTPEQYQPDGDMGDADHIWEACQTLNGSWGYHRDNVDWKSPELLIHMLIDGVSKGGNLLLNVGPTARGRLEPTAQETLAKIGEWMEFHGRSIYGAGPAEFTAPVDCRYTRRGDRLYLHLFTWPFGQVHLRGLADKVTYAQLLNDGSEIPTEVIPIDREALTITQGGLGDDVLTLHLPIRRPDVAVPVIELFLKPTN